MPKFIIVPSDIAMVDYATGKPAGAPVTFRSFLLGDVLDHPAWSEGLDGARMARDLVDAWNEALSGGKMPVSAAPVLELSGALYAKVCDAVKAPSYRVRGTGGMQVVKGFARYSGAGAAQLLPFIDLVLDGAADVDPRLERKG